MLSYTSKRNATDTQIQVDILGGWYEVFPNGVIVGYWSKDKDDMEGFDLVSWKIKASLL